MIASTFAMLDQSRRWLGKALDAASLGPVESPFRVVLEMPGMRLRAYEPSGVPATGPVLLIIPAPIKRSYIWDLHPDVSVVRRCLDRGIRVRLAEWLDPGPAEAGFGLADYADRLPTAALDAIAAETGEAAVLLAGHSIGGTFAVILAALRPERVRGLVLIDAPLAFGSGQGGPLARAAAAGPSARLVPRAAGSPVAGSLVGLLAAGAMPETFLLQRYADLAASVLDPAALALHARVERWMLDEFALPARLFEEVVELLYREDRLVGGTLQVGGRSVRLDRLRAPVIAVVNPLGGVVPPGSMLSALAAVPGLDAEVLTYEGGRGTALQHVGPLVAPVAHQRLWPRILDWMSVV